MAVPVAAGAPCPNCGTLVTCSGLSTDPALEGLCPVDQTAVTVPNLLFVRGAFTAPDQPPLATNLAQTVEVAALEAEVATLQGEVQGPNV